MKTKLLTIFLFVLFLVGAGAGQTHAQATPTPTPTPVDVCPNLDEVQPTVPEGYHLEEDGSCQLDVCYNIPGSTEIPEGYYMINEGLCLPLPVCGEETEEQLEDGLRCVTPTPTPGPTPSNPGGPGDGLSDGRSDGGSSCPSCTAPPPSTGGSVLGASTDVLAATGSQAVWLRVLLASTVSVISLGLGLGLTLKKQE